MRKGVGLTVGLVIVAAAALLGGCSNDIRQQTLWDPTPAEMGPAQTAAEENNGMAHTLDTNGRLFWDDLGRFWLLDRPSHMTPYPIR
jgi:hypothetical protein